MDTTPQADAAPVTPSPAPVVPQTPPANNPTKQNESTVGSVEADIGKLTGPELDQLNGLVGSKLPRDSKGKALPIAVNEEPAPAPKVEEPAPADPAPEPDAAPVETDHAPTDPAPADPAPADPDLDDPEPAGKLPQQRLRATNPIDDMALTLYRKANAAGKKMTLGEAEIEAKRVLGITDKPAETAPVKTMDAAQAELNALREQRKAARTAFDTDAEEAAEIAIETKLEEIRDLKQDATARKQAEIHQTRSELQKSTARALELYPDLEVKPGKPPHRIVEAKDRIWAEHIANGDPIVNRADYPLLLAQMAAADQGVAPKTAQTTPTKPTTPRSVQPAKPVAPIGAAASRTTQPGTGQTAAAVVDSLDARGLQQLTNLIAQQAKR